MARTPEEIKEGNRLRKQEQRKREKAEKLTAKSQQAALASTEEERQKYTDEHARNLAWATEQDKKGVFYEGECLPHLDLFKMYYGANIHEVEVDDEDGPKRKKKAKKNWPNPSLQKITIKAVSYSEERDLGDGVKLSVDMPIEPDCIEGCDHKLCGIAHRQDKEVNDIVSFRRWLDLRNKARLDLFWLGRLQGYGLYHMSHQQVCDQFVQKKFQGMYFPGYTLDDFHSMMRKQKRYANLGIPAGVTTPVETREMMLLEPRSSYKSTINRIDVCQWLINAPDCRIMFITSTKDLAEEFATDIKKAHFYLADGAKPSAFQMLFPEFILTGRDGFSEQSLECPARIHHQPQPSVWASSMQIASTGKHCDICKFDDAVELKNSDTPEKRESLKHKINAYEDVRDPWGFTDVCGTRYFTTDWYGTRQLPQDENSKEVAPLLYSCRSSWELTPGDQKLFAGGHLTVRDVIQQRRAALVHPYKLTWEELSRTFKKKGDRSFRNQQLNIATDPKEDELFIHLFHEDVLRAHTYARSAAPKDMEIIQTWDTAYSEHRTADYSVGALLGIYKDKNNQPGVVVLDLVYDKWASGELASNMLAFYEKHRASVSKVYIEEANGIEFLMRNIQNLAKIRGSDFGNPGTFRLCERSNKSDAKYSRVRNLEFLLSNDRFWIVSGSWLDDLYKQFTDFCGKKSTQTKKDDIPDSISLVTYHLPITALQRNPDPRDIEKEHEERMAKAANEAAYNRTFGSPGTYKHPVASPPPVSVSQWVKRQRGYTPPPEPQVDLRPPQNPRADQLKKIIGKMNILPPGMRI